MVLASSDDRNFRVKKCSFRNLDECDDAEEWTWLVVLVGLLCVFGPLNVHVSLGWPVNPWTKTMSAVGHRAWCKTLKPFSFTSIGLVILA